MRLLLTGFEPFGGETVNPSQEVVRRIAAEPPAGVELQALILPVQAGVSFERLIPAFEAGGFDAWLGLGQAEGRAQLSVERLGVNLRIDRDGEGRELQEETIVEGGPAAEFARLPVAQLVQAILEAGLPAAASNSAGLYICNEVLFAMSHHVASNGVDARVGFIHLPYLPEQASNKPEGTPSLDIDTQTRGVAAAIEWLAQRL